MEIYNFNFSEDELELIKRVSGIDASRDITDDGADDIYEAVANELTMNGFDKNWEYTEIGYICESIITIIGWIYND